MTHITHMGLVSKGWGQKLQTTGQSHSAVTVMTLSTMMSLGGSLLMDRSGSTHQSPSCRLYMREGWCLRVNKLPISLFSTGSCRELPCCKPAGLFGFCSDHEEAGIRQHFEEAVQAGLVDQSVPLCFNTARQFYEYVATFLASLYGFKQSRVDICRDCNPEFKERMMSEGRCAHHETVFIKSQRMGGDLVGVAISKSTAAWENAMMGMSGEVVKLPPHYAIDATLKQIHKDAEPKKRGPKFKKDR